MESARILGFLLLCILPLYEAANTKYYGKVGKGLSCSIALEYTPEEVTSSKITCKPRKTTKKIEDFEFTTEDGFCTFTLTFYVRKGRGSLLTSAVECGEQPVPIPPAPSPISSAFEYPPGKEGDEFVCQITPSDGCFGSLTVKNENFTLLVDSLDTTDCPPDGQDFITVFSQSPNCEGFEFIIGEINGVLSATAFPRNGTLPCPLIGFAIVIRPGDVDCAPYQVTDGECLCNNDCFQVTQGWEECASQCVGVTGTADLPNRGDYNGWSYVSRAVPDYAGNCCCKNIKNGIFQGNYPSGIFGDRKCLGAGRNSP